MAQYKKNGLRLIALIGLMLVIFMATLTLSIAGVSVREKPDFFTMKQEMVTRLQTELACAESAKDEAALHACRPKPPQGGPNGRSNHGNKNRTENDAYNLPEF